MSTDRYVGEIPGAIETVEARLPHETDRLTCLTCGHMWVGIWPLGALVDELECPHCHAQDTEVGHTYYGALS